MIPKNIPEVSQDLIHDLRAAVSEAHFDLMTRLLYSTDASVYQKVPLGVVLPHDADEVAAAVEVAVKHHAPILPRGGGSSLDGQTVGHCVVLDFTKYMN